jgi:hypothetical protein
MQGISWPAEELVVSQEDLLGCLVADYTSSNGRMISERLTGRKRSWPNMG